MSSYRNRRVRAQRKRHSRTVAQLKDRIRTFEEQGRKKEAKVAQDRLLKLLLGVRCTLPMFALTRDASH